MKKILLIVSTALLLSLGVSVSAQPGGGILRMDSDGDGRVSPEEFSLPEQHRGPKMLARSDMDDDGAVTRDEMEASIEAAAQERQARRLAKFDDMDADGNGVVTQDEAQVHAFSSIDADGDGYLTEEEARAMREKRREMHRGKDASR